ncbi:caspase family protein [Halomonas kalidii]|uniref:Caspase family protein n=1 Tax=Halomonas kalidii TaxID=3043293 RepID=A0ABT6VGU6_9GAMM|nr:caspase family protein [Halomonas kalidii]MDI5933191.1 caspase family protein [Halomonas kalidii]
MKSVRAIDHSSASRQRLSRASPAWLAGAVLLLAGCAPNGAMVGTDLDAQGTSVEDLYIVDCLLTGQVRRLGGTTFLTPRRAIRTTAQDCRIRGGEYVAYDRADYRTALNVWLEHAEAGDPEAQNYVGEIFEKGLGQEPDYVSAATWYRRAADQGYARAQINLGFLHEQGLGVEQDRTRALNLYRRASGATEDPLVFRSDVTEEMEALRAQLDARVDQAERQARTLQQQLQRLTRERDELQQRLAQAEATAGAADADARARELAEQLEDARSQVDTLETLFQRASQEREALVAQIRELPEAPAPASAEPVADPEPDAPAVRGPASFAGIDFGRYFALVIGNQEYLYLEDLESPLTDAQRIQQLLENRYGFNVTFLPNADQVQIMSALNDLHDRMGERDNLLIYYAGHGNRSNREDGRRQRSYWLPVDAEAERLVRWINNAVVSDHLDRIQARSILVLADSVFASSMASDSSSLLLGSGQRQLSAEEIRAGLQRRSRIVISSGGERPVPDRTDRPHSLFSRSLIEVLEHNQEVLRENMLFAQVAVNVRRRASGTEGQTPEMRPIRAAGHEGGDFYFVPVAAQRVASR